MAAEKLDVEHEHPLTLIDLHMEHEDYEEDDDDDIGADFSCLCNRCYKKIHWLHRCYYKCSVSCNYSLHKFCTELFTTLQSPYHPNHDLILHKQPSSWYCEKCCRWQKEGICYLCTLCKFAIDLSCLMTMETRRIYHPGHPHPLISITINPILCDCFACWKKHEGYFYHCITCFNFSVHVDCAFLPRKLLLQKTTNDRFNHTHPLTLSYSFPDLEEKCNPCCRICDKNFFHEDWVYMCDKCRFYVHFYCATSREEPFMSILSTGQGKTHKNFEDADYPDLLHFPLPDESYSILPHQIIKGENSRDFEEIKDEKGHLIHFSHEHSLVLIHVQSNNDAVMTNTSRIKSLYIHNPMKRIKLLCNGCVRPITKLPFYKCSQEDECCNFVLHEWCTRLPSKLPSHPGHLQHPLFLKPNAPYNFFGVFKCKVCHLLCNGFAYCCATCDYYVDVICGFLPKNITHEAHPNHILSIRECRESCHACLMGTWKDGWALSFSDTLEGGFFFSCSACNFNLHPDCALLLPRIIRHKSDKHPLKLTYLPLENHKSEYFCEICENKLNPQRWFYHCSKCAQSVHSSCAPLILQSEQDVYCGPLYFQARRDVKWALFDLLDEKNGDYWNWTGVYKHVNIKFGGVFNYEDHPHPLSLAQGIESDSDCIKCQSPLRYQLIFKCFKCKFALDYDCGQKFAFYCDGGEKWFNIY